MTYNIFFINECLKIWLEAFQDSVIKFWILLKKLISKAIILTNQNFEINTIIYGYKNTGTKDYQER